MSKDYSIIDDLRTSGISWEVISETVDWFTDNDRKVYAGWLLGKEETDNVDLLKLAKKSQMIRTSAKRLGIERSINNEQIRDIALHQTFTDQVISAIKEKYQDFNITPHTINSTEKAHIFVLADFHFDGDTNYLNVLNRATSEIIKVIQEKELTDIYLIELGDTIDGASLRTSQLMGVKSGMINQVIEVADAYIKLITKLSEYVNVRFISVDSSNHTQLRNLGTKQNQLIEEDVMLVLNKMIELALPNLDFQHDKELFIDILGFECFIAHSHEVKGNAIKYIKDVVSHRNRLVDYAFFGHRHHQETIDINSANDYDKKLFYCPSLSTKLSQFEQQHNLSSQAGVGYYVIESGKGHIESRKLLV